MKKYKLKRWVKVVITLMLIVSGILIYRYLGFLGAIEDKTTLGKVFLFVGWFWLLFGQIMMLSLMWEE